jgi:hypothetical protein
MGQIGSVSVYVMKSRITLGRNDVHLLAPDLVRARANVRVGNSNSCTCRGIGSYKLRDIMMSIDLQILIDP